MAGEKNTDQKEEKQEPSGIADFDDDFDFEIGDIVESDDDKKEEKSIVFGGDKFKMNVCLISDSARPQIILTLR